MVDRRASRFFIQTPAPSRVPLSACHLPDSTRFEVRRRVNVIHAVMFTLCLCCVCSLVWFGFGPLFKASLVDREVATLPVRTHSTKDLLKQDSGGNLYATGKPRGIW